MRQLPPLIMTPGYYEGIEKEIDRLLYDLIYHPLLVILHDGAPEVRNSVDALEAAARRGSIWYQNGKFYGKYSAAITRALRDLGATFNRATDSWTLEQWRIPANVKFALNETGGRIIDMQRSMITVLDGLDIDTIDHNSDTVQRYDDTVTRMEKSFQDSVSAVEAISVAPKLTAQQSRMIAREWGQNLDLYVKGWAQQSILDMREAIQPGILAGGRAEALVDAFQRNYGASKTHAKFLARQETSLLMAKFRESRYTSVGVDRYRWSTSHDGRVRHDHRELNGKIFRFDSPPVTNKKTGARNNPGEDFGCRCVAVGLVE